MLVNNNHPLTLSFAKVFIPEGDKRECFEGVVELFIVDELEIRDFVVCLACRS
jgi:hypothetical protein